MTVLLTGGAGYIGSHVLLALLAAGETPVVLDDLSTGNAAAVPPGVELVRGSTADADLLRSLVRDRSVDEVMHFAGSLLVEESNRRPLEYWRNNVSGLETLLAVCLERDVPRLVFSSSAAVYGDVGMLPVKEDAPFAPVSPYGQTKAAGEWMIAAAARGHGLRYAALRYFNVAGADPQMRTGQRSPVSTHLMKIAAEAAAGSRSGVTIHGADWPTPDGTCIRDYVHVVDLAQAHVDALRWLRTGGAGGPVNVGYGQGFSVRQVVDATLRVSGTRFEVSVGARRDGDPASIVADPAKAKAELGWKPRYDDLDAIVGHAVAWERKLLG